MNLAINTKKLIERISKNRENQDFSLEDWIFADLNLERYKNILELCSGTGLQSEYIIKNAGIGAKIILSDISKESTDILKQKFGKKKEIKIINQDVDKLLDSLKETFDLVFVSYGLYYSKYAEHILCGKIARLIKPGGRFTVVGPYRGNNSEFFGYLSSLGVQIPRPVIHCCEEFMENILHEMAPFSSKIRINFVENVQKWNSWESLLAYWQNSTFHDARREEILKKNIKIYFDNNSYFQVTKKIAKFEITLKG